MKVAAAGFLLGLAVAAAVVAVGIAQSLSDISARRASPPVEAALVAWAIDWSLAKWAPPSPPRPAADPAAIGRGLAAYRDSCLGCHGAPGIEPRGFAAGLRPRPPDLAGPAGQARTEGQLSWIAANGIRLSGMPAFGPSPVGDRIEDVVAFLRRLPDLDPGERAALAVRSEPAPR